MLSDSLYHSFRGFKIWASRSWNSLLGLIWISRRISATIFKYAWVTSVENIWNGNIAARQIIVLVKFVLLSSYHGKVTFSAFIDVSVQLIEIYNVFYQFNIFLVSKSIIQKHLDFMTSYYSKLCSMYHFQLLLEFIFILLIRENCGDLPMCIPYRGQVGRKGGKEVGPRWPEKYQGVTGLSYMRETRP